MVLQHLFPVFLLIILGSALKHFKLANNNFFNTADRLIYYFFFPALLFWKIGGAPIVFSPHILRFYLAVIGAVIVVYLIGIIYITLFKVAKFQAGAFSQSCYRFNTYIGVAVVVNIFGAQGVARFGVLIGVLIPLINLLAVTTLIWFSERPGNWKKRIRITVTELISNPLIIACVSGLIYASSIESFPPILDNTLRLGASASLPLALMSIGGSLTLKTLKRHLPLATISAVLKLLALPVIGCFIMQLLSVNQELVPIGAVFFALPTSTAVYVLSAQLDSDTEYASAAIVLSTILSFFSLSTVIWWFYA
jgi:predicted permease